MQTRGGQGLAKTWSELVVDNIRKRLAAAAAALCDRYKYRCLQKTHYNRISLGRRRLALPLVDNNNSQFSF